MQDPDPTRPEFPVHRQLEAYNACDIDAFMRWWADDCRYYQFPDQLMANGTAQIRERHLLRFKEPNLHGPLIKRIAVADVVIDQETVTRAFSDDPGEVDVVAIYQVEDGKIANAWFKMGLPRPIPHGPVTAAAMAKDLRICFVGDSFVNGSTQTRASPRTCFSTAGSAIGWTARKSTRSSGRRYTWANALTLMMPIGRLRPEPPCRQA